MKLRKSWSDYEKLVWPNLIFLFSERGNWQKAFVANRKSAEFPEAKFYTKSFSWGGPTLSEDRIYWSGIVTKYLDHNSFVFDHAFHESTTTSEVYQHVALPLVDYCVNGNGRSTIIANGQTGSGKSYTIQGVQELLAEDLFLLLEAKNYWNSYFGYCSHDFNKNLA